MISVASKLQISLFWRQFSRYQSICRKRKAFFVKISRNVIITIIEYDHRSWCVCSVPEKQPWCLSFVIKQGYILYLAKLQLNSFQSYSIIVSQHSEFMSFHFTFEFCNFSSLLYPDPIGKLGACTERRCPEGLGFGSLLTYQLQHLSFLF